MYPTVCDSLFNTNTLIIGDRNCGKTTFLKRVVHMALDKGYRLIVFDSATDHIDKSIIVYCKSLFRNWVEIKSPEKDMIGCDIISETFPYDILKSNQWSQLYLFDVSRYLEEGFDYEADDPMRDITRSLYKKLVLQCLAVIYNFVNHGKYIVIMDEIEFMPGMASIIKKYNQKDIFFIDCLHTEDSCDVEISQIFDKRILNIVYPNKIGIVCEKDENQLCGPACLHYLLNVVLNNSPVKTGLNV